MRGKKTSLLIRRTSFSTVSTRARLHGTPQREGQVAIVGEGLCDRIAMKEKPPLTSQMSRSNLKSPDRTQKPRVRRVSEDLSSSTLGSDTAHAVARSHGSFPHRPRPALEFATRCPPTRQVPDTQSRAIEIPRALSEARVGFCSGGTSPRIFPSASHRVGTSYAHTAPPLRSFCDADDRVISETRPCVSSRRLSRARRWGAAHA